MKRFIKHCEAMKEYIIFILKHLTLIKELKSWQYELEVGDPKIAKIDDVIIRLERRHLDSDYKINNTINNMKSGS